MTRLFMNDDTHTLSEFLKSEHLMGLVVIQDGKVRLEHYAPDHSRESRWVSFSSQTVTSLLIGGIQTGTSAVPMTWSQSICRA